ncbi:eukaryotic translation initiation factor 4E transporter isoform X6 [Narcine bancroftii]|uniref:eukaryotic translation initiation factor 4E transporter isoform X6 n=1 Tax=Narcine bancroftii TaxID=1343680 RepID=UPI003831DD93
MFQRGMEKKEWIEEKVHLNTLKMCGMRKPYTYSKEKLLEIKEYPYAKQRPACLLEKYDSEGIWDPEKWHASLYPNSGRSSPLDGTKKDCGSDLERAVLKRRIADPRERIKEEDIDVVLSPQRRSFGGGCHVTSTSNSRLSGSPLENKENENIRGLGCQRRIGSGRIITSRTFDRDGRDKDLRDRDGREGRDRDYKEKRFRREFGDGKRIFGERRRCDSYTEEEPEWFSAGPTSQSETIELTGFDDKVLLEDPRRPKRWRKRSETLKEGVECNGAVQASEISTVSASEADQEVPQEAVLPEPSLGDFDFNEFFNMEKSVPGLASEILPPPVMGPPSPDILGDLLGNQNHHTPVLNHQGHSSPVPAFQQPPPEFFRAKSPIGYAQTSTHVHNHYQGLPLSKNVSPIPQADSPSQMDMQQGAMEHLTFAQDLHVPGGDVYQPRYGKMHHEHSRDGFNVRQQRIRSPGPASQHRLNTASPSQASSFTNVLSPSFTPTSVIRKMFESKDKSKDGKENPPVKDFVEDGHNLMEGSHLSPGSQQEHSNRGASPIGGARSTFHRSAGTTSQLSQMRFTKDQDYRQRSTGRKTPTGASPVPGSFSRPICPLSLVSHVPLVRQSPPHLPPGVVQRMLAQGISPQQLQPALLHTGMFQSGVDLSHLQSLPPTLLGQTFYPLPASGLPLLNPRAAISAAQIQASGTPLQHLAMIRQVLQSPNASGQGPGAHLHLNQQNSTLQPLHQRSGSPVNLSKWFGSDVLQQPLPSMPSKVISVDELELHQ